MDNNDFLKSELGDFILLPLNKNGKCLNCLNSHVGFHGFVISVTLKGFDLHTIKLYIISQCTCDDLLGHPGWHHVQVQQRGQDSLQTSKHGGQTQAEQHDEEEHRPHLRAWHVDHGFGEHDEG